MASIEELFASMYDSYDRRQGLMVKCLRLMEKMTTPPPPPTQENSTTTTTAENPVAVRDAQHHLDFMPDVQLCSVAVPCALIHHDDVPSPTTTEEILVTVPETKPHLVVSHHDHVSDVLLGIDVEPRGVNTPVPANCSMQCHTGLLQQPCIKGVDHKEHTKELAAMCACDCTSVWRPPWPPPMVEQLDLVYYNFLIGIEVKFHTIFRAGSVEAPALASAMDCSSNESSELSDTDIDDYVDKSYSDLKAGKLVARLDIDRFRCPFCPGKKKQDYRYNELLQHVVGVGASNRAAKVKANHQALAKLLKEDHVDAANTLPPRQAAALTNPPKPGEDQEFFVWPWMGIIPNIPAEQTQRNGAFLMQRLAEFKHVKFTAVNFANGYSAFQDLFKSQQLGKRDWKESNRKGQGRYGWLAQEEDYKSGDPVGQFAEKYVLKTVSDLEHELSRKAESVIADLTHQITVKSEYLQQLECKCNQMNLSLQRAMEEIDLLHKRYSEEMQNMQSAACEHTERVFQETDQLRKQLAEKESSIHRKSRQLSESVAQTDMERRKLEKEREKNADHNNSLNMARIEQQKADEKVLRLLDKQKKEKETALKKILQLERQLDEKQKLELDILQLKGNLEVAVLTVRCWRTMYHTGELFAGHAVQAVVVGLRLLLSVACLSLAVQMEETMFHLPEDLQEKSVSGFISYDFCAADEALRYANSLSLEDEKKERTGVSIGGGIGSISDILDASQMVIENHLCCLSPYFIPKILISMASAHVSMRYGFQGPNNAAVTACAAGAHSIGDATRMIQFGHADVMVAGGSESSVDALSIAEFSGRRALPTNYNSSTEAEGKVVRCYELMHGQALVKIGILNASCFNFGTNDATCFSFRSHDAACFSMLLHPLGDKPDVKEERMS